MICDACKRHIDRKFSNSKTVNCLYFHCENKIQCNRDEIVDYCYQKIQPERSKREDSYEAILKDVEPIPVPNLVKEATGKWFI